MPLRRLCAIWVLICFTATSMIGPQSAHAQGVLGLPDPGNMVNLSPAYEPALIKGLTVHKDNPFLFDFILDTGRSGLKGAALKQEGDRLVKYFFASLTIPEKDLWVNLSPYENDRMVPQALGQTGLGRDLLAQDYLLKQLTASLIYPEKNLGREFWTKVYAKAQQQFGTTQIPVNTFNKVWILADKATVYEHNQTAFVVSGHLKVMLDEDYLALKKHQTVNSAHSISSQMIRQIILPEIEQEVNSGKNFARLRQIFYSQILAVWYKKNLKQALLTQVYADQSTVKGINLNDPSIKERIYQQYLKAYKKGVFNYIKEETSPDGQEIPRKYFSGGYSLNPAMLTVTGLAGSQVTRALGDMAMTYSLKVVLDTNGSFNGVSTASPAMSAEGLMDFIKQNMDLRTRQDSPLGRRMMRSFVERNRQELLKHEMEMKEVLKRDDRASAELRQAVVRIVSYLPEIYDHFVDLFIEKIKPYTGDPNIVVKVSIMNALIRMGNADPQLRTEIRMPLERAHISKIPYGEIPDILKLWDRQSSMNNRLVPTAAGPANAQASQAMSVQKQIKLLDQEIRRLQMDLATVNNITQPINRRLQSVKVSLANKINSLKAQRDNLQKALDVVVVPAAEGGAAPRANAAMTANEVSQDQEQVHARAIGTIRRLIKKFGLKKADDTTVAELKKNGLAYNGVFETGDQEYNTALDDKNLELTYVNSKGKEFGKQDLPDLSPANSLHFIRDQFDALYIVIADKAMGAYRWTGRGDPDLNEEVSNLLKDGDSPKAIAEKLDLQYLYLGHVDPDGKSIYRNDDKREFMDAYGRALDVGGASSEAITRVGHLLIGDEGDQILIFTDAAMKGISTQGFNAPGGIDLNAGNFGLTVTRDAHGGVSVNLDPAMIARIKKEGIYFALPVIINVTPIAPTDIRPLLGLK